VGKKIAAARLTRLTGMDHTIAGEEKLTVSTSQRLFLTMSLLNVQRELIIFVSYFKKLKKLKQWLLKNLPGEHNLVFTLNTRDEGHCVKIDLRVIDSTPKGRGVQAGPLV